MERELGFSRVSILVEFSFSIIFVRVIGLRVGLFWVF